MATGIVQNSQANRRRSTGARSQLKEHRLVERLRSRPRISIATIEHKKGLRAWGFVGLLPQKSADGERQSHRAGNRSLLTTCDSSHATTIVLSHCVCACPCSGSRSFASWSNMFELSPLSGRCAVLLSTYSTLVYSFVYGLWTSLVSSRYTLERISTFQPRKDKV